MYRRYFYQLTIEYQSERDVVTAGGVTLRLPPRDYNVPLASLPFSFVVTGVIWEDALTVGASLTMKPYKHVPLDFKRMPPPEQLRASREFADRMAARRSVRFISSEPIPFELIENAIRCASLAPSGANQQPWNCCSEGSGNQAQDPRGGRG